MPKNLKKMMEKDMKGKGVEVEIMRSKPSVYLTSEEMPDIKDWKVGGNYMLKVRQKARTVSESEGKTRISGEFEVMGVCNEDSEDVKEPPEMED